MKRSDAKHNMLVNTPNGKARYIGLSGFDGSFLKGEYYAFVSHFRQGVKIDPEKCLWTKGNNAIYRFEDLEEINGQN